MRIKAGDRIRYDEHHFFPHNELGERIEEVKQVIMIDTGYGEYEEYETVTGEWVSELQLLEPGPV